MARRTAVAARLQSLFDRQTDSLRKYIRLMDAEERSLREEDPGRLQTQLDAERGLLDGLEALLRVSGALEPAYREAHPQGDPDTEAARRRAAAAAAAASGRSPARLLAASNRRAAAAEELRTVRRVLSRVRRSPQDPPRMLDILR